MGALVGMSALAKMISIFTTRKMVGAAAEIHNSNHRLMKLVKAKFEHANLMSDRVQNVEAFVDKFVYEYKVLGVRLYMWPVISKRIFWCVGIVGVFSCLKSYQIQEMGELTISYIRWTGIALLISLVLAFFSDENVRVNATKNYMVEYLANVCAHRYIRKQEEEVEETQEVQEEVVAEVLQEEEEEILQMEDEAYKKSEQERRIRAILEEFFA